MPKTRPPYSPEFRRQMVDLVRAGRDPADLAREFEPTAQSIGHWVAQADRQEGRREEKGGGLTAAERDELARCGVRTSSCGWSATFSLEPLPGSHARPARSRPGLRVHGCAPGGVSGCRDGTRARRVGGWLSCVATPTGVCSCRRPDPRRAAGACGAPGRRGEAWA